MKHLLTPYGADINPLSVLQEYPRPQLKRSSYMNLNGYWDFHITKDDWTKHYDDKIMVPFSPESILSGVNRMLKPNEYAFYHKTINCDDHFLKDVTLIHFGAVDQICDVWINGHHAITHVGGFTPFSVDISSYIIDDVIDIVVRVKDLSDTSYHLTGKQRIHRGGIWYTPQSGIWQTVWMESLPKNHIKDLTLIPHFDDKKIEMILHTDVSMEYSIHISINNQIIYTKETHDTHLLIDIDPFYPWTPQTPSLYGIDIIYGDDHVKSYVGMRKFSKNTNNQGVTHFYLNNEPYFLSGVLDQGYYSDGLLTPPSDQAMIDDIMLVKNLGFNLIRKHIKIEPLRFYYHCDRLGIIVWQDMINGSTRKDIMFHGILGMLNIHINDKHYRLFGRHDKEGRYLYEKDLSTMMNHLKNVTSIATWVPFNEAWGQFDAKRITKQIFDRDQTRLIDHASGWSDQHVGDYYSRHIYFTKVKFKKRQAKTRIIALTEFGGYSLAINEHRFNEDKVFGYKVFRDQESLTKGIERLYESEILPNIKHGLNVLIYTQLSDVEDEVNGFITYDRKVLKINPKVMKRINEALITRFKQEAL